VKQVSFSDGKTITAVLAVSRDHTTEGAGRWRLYWTEQEATAQEFGRYVVAAVGCADSDRLIWFRTKAQAVVAGVRMFGETAVRIAD